jgi:hypothetical protein
MKNINENISLINSESISTHLLLNNFNVRRIKMKAKILVNSVLIVIFLVGFSGCNISKKAGTQTSFAGRIISTDSNTVDNSDENAYNNDANYNAQGKTVNYTETAGDILSSTTDGNVKSNKNYEEEEILVGNPYSDDVNLETFESTFSTEGNFVEVTEEQIDPENNVSSETVNCDEDIYTNVIWVPSSNNVSAGWNPYTNGRWVWTCYGWTWKSNYRWGVTYHYGRWWYSSHYGWVWSPGRKWAPAWVVWGHHKNYEGWHPISPRIHIQKKSIISPVVPRNRQNGWVIVKKNDFTKTVNSSTVISDVKKKDIIKNSTAFITLKQDANIFHNENPNIKTKESVQVKGSDKKTMTQVIAKQTSNTFNKTLPVTKTKQTNTINTGVESKKKNIENPPVTSTSVNKQVNNSSIGNKNYETKKNENITQKKVTKTKSPVSVPSSQNSTVNVNKSNTNENRTTVKDNTKNTTETKSVSVEKSRNNNNTTGTNSNTSNNVKTYNSYVTPKIESSNKPSEKTVNKTENNNRTVNTTPKVEQSPKTNREPMTNSQTKSTK